VKPATVVALLVCAFGVELSADPTLVPLRDAPEPTRAVVEKVVSAFGGESRLAAIASVRERFDIIDGSGSAATVTHVEGIAIFPDRLYASIRTASDGLTLFVNGEEAYLIPTKGPVEGAAIRLTATERDDLVRLFAHDPLIILRERWDSHYLFAAGAPQTSGKKTVLPLYISGPAIDTTWLIDTESGEITRSNSGTTTTEYSDWRHIGPTLVPFTSRSVDRDSRASEVRRAEYELNPMVDADLLFRKPSLWLMRLEHQPTNTETNAYRPGPALNVIPNSSATSESSRSSSPMPSPRSVVYVPPEILYDAYGNVYYP
jgi:hypothetical protein